MNKIINPATSETIAEIPAAALTDINAALNLARAAADSGDWGKSPLAERKAVLLKISESILEQAADLAKLETLNTGKPIKETTFMDVPSAARTFAYFANHLEEYLQARDLQVNEHTRARLAYEPRGVVVLIVPWNYPLLIASWKLAPALACGNSVILKPSSLTPLTAVEIGKIAVKAGLPKGVLQVVNASGDWLGEALCADKRVDMISFTGSNSVGQKILQYTAKNVKKTTMELGGKSAAIILKDADFEAAVNGSLCSIFLNQGQMCTAMSRILVEDDIYDRFVAEFGKRAARIKLGNGLDYETQMGPLISRAQRDQAVRFVEQAKAQGAKLVCGGKIPIDPGLKDGFFFEPTVFTGVSPEASIFREEVFAPVVCINKFSTVNEAVESANQLDFGLAGCIWTQDLGLAETLAAQIDAGTIWINTYGMFHDELPYGGFKQSGFGKELGKEGFLEYARLKNIVVDQTKDAKPLVNYWYGF